MDNLTPFEASCLPSMNLQDEELRLVVVAGRFDIPSPGSPLPTKLAISEEQHPAPLEDEHNGEPSTSSLKWEGQSCCMRPGTDIYVNGHAWAPAGRPITQSAVSVQVGQCHHTAAVFGERVWRATFGGMTPTSPLPFDKVPLLYERSFGGFVEDASGSIRELSDRNPVGRGLFARPASAEGQPLPNIEDPQDLISDPSSRPRPRGFGPVARSWHPRRSFGGTFDQEWVRQRAPLWPKDLDPRFFRAASEGLHVTPHLQGGESVALIGLHPDGPIHFQLPHYPLLAKFSLKAGEVRRSLLLDAVMLDLDSMNVTLVWRGSVVTRPSALALENVLVRPRETWEEAPPA